MIATIKQFFRRVKRTLEFIPIIWRGYDFDYRYALELFSYQLNRLADHLESDKAYTVKAKSNARRLRTILELMNKVYDEEYRLEHYDKVEAIYGKWDIEWRDNGDGTSTYMGAVWEKADTPEKQKEANELLSKLALESEQKHQRAKELLWKLIDHNLHCFWD
jgi:hypothetical protein